MKKLFILLIFTFLLLTGCGIDKKTETFIKDYLTLRFETVNMINEKDSGVLELIEHIEMVEPYISEERFKEYAQYRESQLVFRADDYWIKEGGTMTIQSITLNKVEKNEYTYELIIIIDDLTVKLRTKVSGLLKIDENGLIYYDKVNREKGVTEKID